MIYVCSTAMWPNNTHASIYGTVITVADRIDLMIAAD